jgi:hypothetical protein
MQSHTCLLSAFTLSTAMAFGVAALAADLPKEGTFDVTYTASGTAKVTSVIGKERVLIAWDENGVGVGTGLFDHATWHCFGVADISNGVLQATNGYCVGTDLAGDQIVAKLTGDSEDGSATLTTGTGKYAGISGGFKYLEGAKFRTATEGTYAHSNHTQGNYKLP